MVAVVVGAWTDDDQLGMLPGGRDMTAVRRARPEPGLPLKAVQEPEERDGSEIDNGGVKE
jgi:hypothetical protein